MSWSAIIVLGAVGAVVRALVTLRLSPLLATATVNIAAAFLLGLTSPWEGAVGAGVRIGLLGSLSTWSTLAHQLAELTRTGQGRRATAYLAVTMVAGVGAAWIGLKLS